MHGSILSLWKQLTAQNNQQCPLTFDEGALDSIVDVDSEAEDVEVDVCPQCGGTPCEWTEFGEEMERRQDSSMITLPLVQLLG